MTAQKKPTHIESAKSTISTSSIGSQHIPVLLKQVLHYLCPQPGESYLDLTAGYGGHAREVLALTHTQTQKDGNRSGSSVLVDRDSKAVAVLRKEFAEREYQEIKQNPQIMHSDFYAASTELHKQGRRFDMILADLGVSSPHLNVAERGFAIAAEGPLDMRMDQSQTLTAATIVNTYSVDALADILERYGEEPKSRQIARLIVQAREASAPSGNNDNGDGSEREPQSIATTTQLAKIVARAWPGHSKTHPATRTFQALRIAVNDEIEMLRRTLPVWMDLLAPGGRLVIISFHSLEDRIVKQAFADSAAKSGGAGQRYDTELQLLTKRPVTADHTEIVFNPRARSAKLRAVCKQK